MCAAGRSRTSATATTSPPRSRTAPPCSACTCTSMGQEAEAQLRRQVFASHQVSEDLFALARPGALFMHCLPAHRGEEVTADVFESDVSVVFDQAENRLHGQKALLLMLLVPSL